MACAKERKGESMKQTAHLGFFLAFALICSYIESLLPFHFGVPGIKLGLTNIVVLLMLYTMGAKYAFAVSVARIFLAGLLFGNLFSILYSLAGGALSFVCMLLLKQTEKFHMISISAVGGAAHNLGQVVMAAAVVENSSLFYYYPVLLLAGVVTGILIGVTAQEILLRLPKG